MPTEAFRVSDYGDLREPGENVWRGWIFQVSESTVVTHLIGGGTSGTFQVSLAEVDSNDGEVVEILGAANIGGDNSELAVELSTPVTLTTGVTYALVQGRVMGAGSHYRVENVDVDALEAHPRILAGSWMPDTGDHAYRWWGGYGVGLAPEATLNANMPRIGFRYQP